jgi:hypothetical protein
VPGLALDEQIEVLHLAIEMDVAPALHRAGGDAVLGQPLE